MTDIGSSESHTHVSFAGLDLNQSISSLLLSSSTIAWLDKSKYITSDYAQSAMHMQFMQMNQHRLAQSNAAMMSSEMQAQAQQLQRAIEENNNKNTNIANLNRANLWETCSASYESFVKNLERYGVDKFTF